MSTAKANVSGQFLETRTKAEAILLRMLEAGCDVSEGPCDDLYCFYCSAWLGGSEDHTDDCAYVEARRLLDG